MDSIDRSGGHQATTTARHVVVEGLTVAAERFPELGPSRLSCGQLSDRDAALARAIHRTCLKRWLTIEYLLDGLLRQPARELEPVVRALLLVGGAQLLFFDRMPARAIVHESVELVRAVGRPKAAGLVNAVLRRLAELVNHPVFDQPWTPAADRVPLEEGFLMLTRPILPDPRGLAKHLSVATSNPRYLLERWVNLFGPEQSVLLATHGIKHAPTIVATERGFRMWEGSHQQLKAFLVENLHHRVQDPASARPVEATRSLRPKMVVDFCAGLGTKTRQLASLHAQARVFATDGDDRRRAILHHECRRWPSITVVEPGDLPGAVDLMVLDVPCTNTAVLARRPEARYRFNRRSLSALVALQRRIIDEAIPHVGPGAHVLYSTCSLDSEENRGQVDWLTESHGGCVLSDQLTLPTGSGAKYHDGGYFALVAMPGGR